jgi:hypothetical protein
MHPEPMTANRDTLEKLGRFLLRGLRIGASTVAVGGAVAALRMEGTWRRWPDHFDTVRPSRGSPCGTGARHGAGEPSPTSSYLC